jgi:hypothetical protein
MCSTGSSYTVILYCILNLIFVLLTTHAVQCSNSVPVLVLHSEYRVSCVQGILSWSTSSTRVQIGIEILKHRINAFYCQRVQLTTVRLEDVKYSTFSLQSSKMGRMPGKHIFLKRQKPPDLVRRDVTIVNADAIELKPTSNSRRCTPFSHGPVLLSRFHL